VGTIYKEDMDLARVDLKKDAVEKTVDQSRVALAKDGTRRRARRRGRTRRIPSVLP